MMTTQMEGSLFQPDVLAGRVALITGGGTGIGAGIASMLGRHGCDVVLASRRGENLVAMAAQLEAMGRGVLSCSMDVRDRDACDQTVAQALDRFGRVDILVNNAAGNFLVRTADLSERGWRSVVEIVLGGTFNMSQAVYAAMREAGGGSIVNITTTYIATGAPLMAHSGAAKAGVLNLTRTLAVEWGADGIRVNAIAPGLVEGTEGARRLSDSINFTETYKAGVPLRRLVSIDDVAATALFLVTPAAALITGVEIIIDGGASLGGHFKEAAELFSALQAKSAGARRKS